MFRRIMVAVGSFLLMVSLSVGAVTRVGEKSSISGFGSLSATYADSESLGFRRDVTQQGVYDEVSYEVDSLLGLQFDHQFNDSLKATVQTVLKQRAVNDLDSSVEWAYLSYQNTNDWKARFGRIAINMTLIDEFGNVGYAYDWVRPTKEFYSPTPIYSIDGGDFTWRRVTENGVASVKLFAGNSKRHYESSDFDMTPFIGAAFQYEANRLSYRASLSQTQLTHFYSERVSLLEENYSSVVLPEVQTILNKLNIDGSWVNHYSLGADYRHGDWRILGEVAYLDSNAELFLPYITAYTGVVKRFEQYSLFSLVSHGHTTQSPYQAPTSIAFSSQTQYLVQQIFNYADVDQTTFSVGTRWDFKPNLALKLQWDRTWVAKNQAMLWERASDETTAQTVDIVAVSLNFVF